MGVLYLTQNGITDHIGQSQVAPYVMGLARKGFRIHVVSAEKSGRQALIQHHQTLFDGLDVRWTRVPYLNRPKIFGQLTTQMLMHRAARRIIQREDIRVIHSRSFPPALIARKIALSTGIKFLFDFRDFYADRGLIHAKGLSRLIFHQLKRLEGPMILAADKVVCLTHRATDLLTSWYLKDDPHASKRFEVIPCCADFNHFDLAHVSPTARSAARVKAGLEPDDFVLLYLGSLGPDYLLPEMLTLFKQVAQLRPRARFLFVSNNGRDLVEVERRSQGISADMIRFVSADRAEIPAYLSLADISVVFIRADQSTAGCSPTKLAELFACEVPVIANAGVGDLDQIIDLERNGSVLVRNFAAETLREAVLQVIDRKSTRNASIRTNSHEFSLEEGVKLYANVYRELLGAAAGRFGC